MAVPIKVRLRKKYSATAETAELTVAFPAEATSPVHVLAGFAADSKQAFVYVDGQLEANGTTSANRLASNPVIEIGGNTLDRRYFAGNIDEERAGVIGIERGDREAGHGQRD